VIAFSVRYYDSIGSTNDEALRLAHHGAPHGTAVCARQQTAGRGRHARHWHSPTGNLYVSLLLRPVATPAKAAELSFVTALAVADTVDWFLPDGIKAELKWPNDVLVRGAKIAGILLEYADAAVIVGIGINVRHAPSGTPYPVTSLAACGTALPESATALPVLLEAFNHRFSAWDASGFHVVRDSWLSRAHPPGSPLRVTSGTSSVIGRFLDLTLDGALIVETADGLARIVAGDVVRSPTTISD
jgi:BirA family transcriptional regulator, biotin operon repressor / biotin---[acetyl-CoA-carboxylase] ligase